ncbi:hypothetical protein ES332_A04G103700v1 [Gossypium tomentosum]|uniref:Translin n=1 Tax=Gossypium tomentosum TaxID=34277 RepID=A0A5D2QY67_GOSTO|nr:hypothetical protein ES332_A04G103700v1 [Gossypium tomentosum]
MKSALRNAYYFTLSRYSLNPNPSLLQIAPFISTFPSLPSVLSRNHPFRSPLCATLMAAVITTRRKPLLLWRNSSRSSESSLKILAAYGNAYAPSFWKSSRRLGSCKLASSSFTNLNQFPKANSQINVLKGLYNKLAEVVRECPGQYYRYHGDWRSETQMVVSLLAFMHWLETGNLLMHTEAEEKLGLNNSDFALDLEDYLVGVCFMSTEMPRYVVNQVTAGDYDCPRKVLKFLTDLHAAFRMLNLRNDFLRKKFDSMKYDLRRVEEVYYDVKIRGLATTGDSVGDQGAQKI